MSVVEVRVPDIGDAKGVEVVDVLVKKGSEIRVDDPLITLETDKASMDVPSPVSGTVDSIELKKGDEVIGRRVDRHRSSGRAAAHAHRARACSSGDAAAAPAAAAPAQRRLPRRRPRRVAAPAPAGGTAKQAGDAGAAAGSGRPGGSRRRGGRLHRSISRRRSGPQGHVDRALADAWAACA